MKKVLYIATTADRRNRLDGETVKCRLLRNYLEKIEQIKLVSIDTDHWQKHILKLPFLILFHYFNCDEIVLSSADRGAHILLNFLKKVKSKKKVFYFVVGGSLYRNILEKKWNINCYQNLAHIYVESKILKKDLNSLNISCVDVIYNFRKVEQFENKYRETDFVKFVFYGRVIKEKGIEEAIQLVRRLNEENIPCVLDIYGQCKLEYFEKIQKKFTEQITYHGEIQPDGKIEYEILSQYDIFLFPTEYPGECLPGALIDSYIAGLAVVASNWKYAKEYIHEGENGIIFDYKNYEDMYLKTKQFIISNKILAFKKRSLELSKHYRIEFVLEEFKQELME